MSLFKIFANFLLFFKPLPSNHEMPIEKKSTYYPSYAHQVVDLLKEEVEKEYRVRCCGIGGSMPYDIMSIDVDFQTKQPASIELARELIVSISEKFYHIINSHKNVKPFLREYLFPIERIHVSICFDHPVKRGGTSYDQLAHSSGGR